MYYPIKELKTILLKDARTWTVGETKLIQYCYDLCTWRGGFNPNVSTYYNGALNLKEAVWANRMLKWLKEQDSNTMVG